jgi:hypothetical protein
MNILQSKSRNRLTPERVDKLLYIQINRRTLRRDPQFSVLESDDEEDVAMQPGEQDTMISVAGHGKEVEMSSPGAAELSEDDFV